MFHSLPSRPFLKLAVLFFGFIMPALGQEPAETPKEQKATPKIRLICVSSLADEQEVILASRDEKGKWLELGMVKLRSSFITDWLPAMAGELHLALREEGALKSIAKFNLASARRALVVLIANPPTKSYMASVIDPEKLAFAKGSVLVINFSSQPGMVLLGSKKLTVNSGQREVAQPALESNGNVPNDGRLPRREQEPRAVLRPLHPRQSQFPRPAVPVPGPNNRPQGV